MSPDEFYLFFTYLYLFGNKRVKCKSSFFFLSGFPDAEKNYMEQKECNKQVDKSENTGVFEHKKEPKSERNNVT